MSKPELGEQTEKFWEDFHEIEGIQTICDLWDKAFNRWVIEDIAQVLIKHGIVSPPVKWIEITDDPATWPLHSGVVLVKNANDDVAFMVCHYGHAKIGLFWATPKNMHWTEDGKIEYDDFSLVNVPFQDATHWRLI